MADPTANANAGWKLATAVLAAIAVGTAAFGFVEYRTAGALTEQLSAATTAASQARKEAENLKGQLSAVQEQASTEQQRRAAAEQQVSAEQQQLQSAQARLAAESRPDLPLSLTFRDALLGSGKVAVMQNLSDSTLEVVLEVQSPVTGAHFRQAYVINARGVAQIGQAQGWPFASGQSVAVSNPRYRPRIQTVP